MTAMNLSEAPLSAAAAHPFDEAVQLRRDEAQPDLFHGGTSAAYGNMVGPFGGITAAVLLQAVMQHPQRIGEPLSLTVNFAAPVADGEFQIIARAVRTNRSTQHWSIEMKQQGETVTLATALFATRRETWSATDASFPLLPDQPANQTAAMPVHRLPAWVQRYDIQVIRGMPGFMAPEQPPSGDSVSMQWIRDEPRRALDFCSLTAICDAFFPRVFVRRQEHVPAGTVSMTIYFHADSAMLAAHGAQELLGYARASRFYNNYFDQSAEIWTPSCNLLATTTQVVYFKQ